jgi:hypothetical protein
MKQRSIIPILLAGALVPLACRGKLDTDNPDVASGYRNTNYQEDIVTGEKRKDYEDQGKGISPAALSAITDLIESAYKRDFERCLEGEMAKLNTRFLRSVFTVEFTIQTTGKVKDVKVLEVKASRQDAKGKDLGPIETDGMKQCIVEMVAQWEFTPAPEIDYRHTYAGQAGEAF